MHLFAGARLRLLEMGVFCLLLLEKLKITSKKGSWGMIDSKRFAGAGLVVGLLLFLSGIFNIK